MVADGYEDTTRQDSSRFQIALLFSKSPKLEKLSFGLLLKSRKEFAQSLAEVKMEDFNKIRARLFLTNPDAATAEAFDRAIDSGSIMRDAVCPVLDVNGNSLVAGAIYQYQRRHTSVKIKIREWVFGSGNLLDRYYRVFYTDDQLEDSFLVVEAQYPNGVFGGAVYPSKLVPVEKSAC